MPSLAALNSWSREYTDQGILAAFQEHVKSNFSRVKTKSSELPLYARLIAIIQSSGTGKSRLMDEMAKRLFQISINLRSPETGGLLARIPCKLSANMSVYLSGFPHTDVGVRSYFLDDKNETPVSAYLRSLTFLEATFTCTLEVITSSWPASPSSELPSLFRFLLSQGQSTKSVGFARSKFYEKVVSQARQVWGLPSLYHDHSRPNTTIDFGRSFRCGQHRRLKGQRAGADSSTGLTQIITSSFP